MFSIDHPIDGRVRDALLLIQEEDWRQAINQDGTTREGSWVVEITLASRNRPPTMEFQLLGVAPKDRLTRSTA